MLSRIVENFKSRLDGDENPLIMNGNEQPVVLDLTFGMGGHSLSLLKKYPLLKIVATEVDKKVLD